MSLMIDHYRCGGVGARCQAAPAEAYDTIKIPSVRFMISLGCVSSPSANMKTACTVAPLDPTDVGAAEVAPLRKRLLVQVGARA
jgi:hypothetical protein